MMMKKRINNHLVMENEAGDNVDDDVNDGTKEGNRTMIMDKVKIMMKTSKVAR